MATRILLIASLFFSAGAVAQQVQDSELQSSSTIITIVLKSPVTPPAPVQAKDNLLWYKGKKIDDSTLITPQSTLVRWSKQRNIVIVQPKKDPLIKVANELQKTEARKQDFYNKMAERKNSVLYYPAIVNTMNEFDVISEKYAQAIKNTIDLPPALATAYNPRFSTGGVASVKLIVNLPVPEYMRKAYQEVLADMKNYPPIDFPAPPATDFSSCLNNNCDSNARKNNDNKDAEWLKAFTEYEAGIIGKSLAIIQKISQLGLDNDPEAVPVLAGLDKAMDFAFARAINKVDLLIRKYGNNFSMLPSVIRAALSVERQKQLIGAGNGDNYASTITRLSALFDGFEKFMEQQMDARNYDVVLNLPFVMGIERQRQLLGVSDDAAMGNITKYIEKINAFNRFKMDVQIDYEGEWKDCGIAKASFTATNLEEGFVQLGLINCKYNFFLAEEYINKSQYPVHYGNAYHIPLQVTNGTGTEVQSSDDGEKCWQIKHDLRGLAIRPYEPIASISFCEKDTDDSLQFYSMHLPVSRENRDDIRYNYARFKHFDTQIQNDGFASGNIPAEIEQMGMELEELKTSLRGYQTKSITKPSLNEMEKHHFEANRAKWLQRKINEYEERSKPSVIVFDAKNKAEVIIDERTSKNYNETINDNHEKADVTVRIKVAHAPLPYKKVDIKKN